MPKINVEKTSSKRVGNKFKFFMLLKTTSHTIAKPINRSLPPLTLQELVLTILKE